MSLVKQINRLHQQGKKIKQIAAICQVSKNTVKKYPHLARSTGIDLEALLEMEPSRWLSGAESVVERSRVGG